jgi:hypothetical protein
MLYAHATRIADAWSPDVERILLPAKEYPEETFDVRVAPESTAALGYAVGGPRRRMWVAARRATGAAWTLERPGELIYDARWDSDGNIAHVLGNVISRVLLARRLLRGELGSETEITVVLRTGASQMARTVYDLLKIPVLCTDDHVSGELVRVTPSSPYALYPGLFDLEFEGYVADTPERVFVSRTTGRTLENEEEVAEWLGARGFERLYFEDIPIPLQWSVMRNARTAVCLHGAAMASLVFSRRPALRVLELFSAGWVNAMYRLLVGVMRGRWCGVRGRITSQIVRDLEEHGEPERQMASPTHIDLETLELGLDYLQARAGADLDADPDALPAGAAG